MKFSPWVLTAVIAICSIASPIITAWINNRYALKTKELDLRESVYKERMSVIRDKYISYLSTGSAAFFLFHASRFNEFNIAFGEIVGLAPDNISSEMVQINMLIQSRKYEQARSLFNDLIPEIRDQMQSLGPR